MGAAATRMFPPAKIMPEAAAALDDDNLLSEILLCLPPLPSSLPRASGVCKRWHSLATDPGFIRRFRLCHRDNPRLLGYFHFYGWSIRFEPTMEPPKRVPCSRFSSPIDDGDDRSMLLGCCHGLLLIWHYLRDQVLVWDPVSGDQRLIATPPGFGIIKIKVDGTVLRATGDDNHFQVVLTAYEQEEDTRVIVFIYSSGTHLWSTPRSAPFPYDVYDWEELPAVLVGNSLYWLGLGSMLEVDLCGQSIAINPVPEDMIAIVMWAEGGGVGLLSLQGYTVQLSKRDTDCHGVASWVLGRSFELDKLLQLDSQKGIRLQGYAEENNVMLLRTFPGFYMLQLESLQFSKLVENKNKKLRYCYALESVYAAGNRYAVTRGYQDE